LFGNDTTIRVEIEREGLAGDFLGRTRDFDPGNFYIRLGFGAGKVWKLESGTTLNLFAEP